MLGMELSIWKQWKRSDGRYDGERACLVIDRRCISLWGKPDVDCHWDCSYDRPVDVSAAAIAWVDFFLSLFSFFFILLYIFLDCC